MNLDEIAFPALIIADDGWVQEISRKDTLDFWRYFAITKYNRRRVIFYDSEDRVWQVESIAADPALNGLRKAIAKLTNRKLQVNITLRRVSEAPLQTIQRALEAAVDADDDILTQFSDGNEIRSALRETLSFKSVVSLLRSKGAI